jgi:hypothetical protein
MKKDKATMIVNKSELERSVQTWVNSPKGQESIREVLQNSDEMKAKLREARDIDPKSLYDPFTV